jgi:hypothetical protein
MIEDIADSIADEALEIFKLLQAAQGGTAEIISLKKAG